MATTYLTRTFGSGGSTTKWTYSVWLKRGNLSYDTANIFGRYQSSDYFTGLYFSGTDGIQFLQKHAGANAGRLMTSDIYRDVSGWYNIVAVWDTDNVTADDRMKIYVNGVSPTIINRINPSSGFGSTWNTANPNNDIGRADGMDGNTNYFDGSMSHIHFCDGYAYAASDFGEIDATTGEWKIKTSPSVSYGTTGFNILENGNSVTDQSGLGNNFTVGGGTLTNTEDCPSDIFATFNNLNNYWAGSTFSYGNTKVVTSSLSYAANLSTLGASTGKFYAEFKCTDAGRGYPQVGIKGNSPTAASDGVSNGADSVCYYGFDGKKVVGGSASTYGATYGTGDIIGVAMDLTNNRIFFSKNSVWQDSGDPTSSTGAITIPTSTSGFYFMGVDDEDNAGTNTWEANFGNGYFGTTAVSSAGTNASGIGIFEYDTPTGYTALSTKGLQE
tara:strand:+ start:356 stop:1681 length:1326 start_codon:yes stop_codon:yes gene_type:complete